jgi:hypothetical protein
MGFEWRDSRGTGGESQDIDWRCAERDISNQISGILRGARPGFLISDICYLLSIFPMKPGADQPASKGAEYQNEGCRLESVSFKDSITRQKHFYGGAPRAVRRRSSRPALLLAAMGLAWPAMAQEPANNSPSLQAPAGAPTDATQNGAASSAQQSDAKLSGAIRGTVVDKTGTPLAGVHVRVTREGQAPAQEVTTGDDGQFLIVNAAPGAFQLTFSGPSFASQNYSGTLHSGEVLAVPQITLQLATEVTEVRVEESTVEIAQEQLKEQEKQRIFGAIPNFYVTYEGENAAPLNTRQKFELAWKSTLDPVTFGITGAIAGAQQATNAFSGYGQGAQGFGKRYGASYADIVTGTFIGGAILPSVLKQDPRYYYKGSGTFRSRFWYAISQTFICKGDNGRWQFNYSSILGSLAAGGISNAYYPDSDRGAGLTFENFGIGIGATAGVNLLQEFVLRKLTPHAQKPDPANP